MESFMADLNQHLSNGPLDEQNSDAMEKGIEGEQCWSGWRNESFSTSSPRDRVRDPSEISLEHAKAVAFSFFNVRKVQDLKFSVIENSEGLLILIVDHHNRIFAAHQQVALRDIWQVRPEGEPQSGTLSEVLLIIENEIGIAAGWHPRKL